MPIFKILNQWFDVHDISTMIVNAIYDQVLNVCRLHYFTYLKLTWLVWDFSLIFFSFFVCVFVFKVQNVNMVSNNSS